MTKEEIKEMQEKIDAGILLAQKRLIEKVQKEGTVIVDGQIKGLPESLLKGQKATLIITIK